MSSPNQPPAYVPHRVLVLLNKDQLGKGIVYPADKYPVDSSAASDLGVSSELNELCGKFSGVTMCRRHALNGAQSEALQNLLKAAKDQDGNYDYSHLVNHFTVECPPAVNPQEVADWINTNWSAHLYPAHPAHVDPGPASPIATSAPPPDDIPPSFAPPVVNGLGYLEQLGIQSPPASGPTPTSARIATDGSGVVLVDVEQGWNRKHEAIIGKAIKDLLPEGKAPDGDDSDDYQDFQGHGTAVLGILAGEGPNLKGIVPENVTIRVVTQWRECSSMRDAIGGIVGDAADDQEAQQRAAATQGHYDTADALLKTILSPDLQPGDVILLEAQTGDMDPIELESRHTFDLIRLATHVCGLVVVEPAGNGGYDLATRTLPNDQRQVHNVESTDYVDSGAIIVGAATAGPEHSRLPLTNYGKRVDCFAWGEKILTSGNGAHAAGKHNYTMSFGGTSGASAIIAGFAARMQAAARGQSIQQPAQQPWQQPPQQPAQQRGRVDQILENVKERFAGQPDHAAGAQPGAQPDQQTAGQSQPNQQRTAAHTPSQLRNLLKNAETGTKSHQPSQDLIGVMPHFTLIQRHFLTSNVADAWPHDGIAQGNGWPPESSVSQQRQPKGGARVGNGNLEQDQLVTDLEIKPGEPAPIMLTGWLQQLGDTYWRLYLTPDFSSHVDFDAKYVKHNVQAPASQTSLGGTTLWLDHNAVLSYGQTAPLSVQAAFLRGDLAPQQLQQSQPFGTGGWGNMGQVQGHHGHTMHGFQGPACTYTQNCPPIPPGSPQAGCY